MSNNGGSGAGVIGTLAAMGGAVLLGTALANIFVAIAALVVVVVVLVVTALGGYLVAIVNPDTDNRLSLITLPLIGVGSWFLTYVIFRYPIIENFGSPVVAVVGFIIFLLTPWSLIAAIALTAIERPSANDEPAPFAFMGALWAVPGMGIGIAMLAELADKMS